MTMVEKILADHSGQKQVKAGDIVTCRVDWAVHFDVTFSDEGFPELPNRIFNPSRQLVIMDHGVPAPTTKDADSGVKAREFVRKFGIKNFFDVGNHGICHQVVAERGFALPGQLLACQDSRLSPKFS